MTLYQTVSYSSSLLDTVHTRDEHEVEVLRLHGEVQHNVLLLGDVAVQTIHHALLDSLT